MSEQKKRRNPVRVIVPLLLLAGIGFGVWKLVFSKPAEPANIVRLTGRVEGDDSAISPKVSGRLLEIRFREGDSVKAGETIATLDDPQVRAREQQAKDSLTAAEAQLRSAQQQTAILQDQLNQTEMQTGQATLDADSRVREAEAQLSTAEAQLAQQEASMKLAAYDRDAYTRLAKDGAVSERQGKQAQTTAESQEALVAAARRTVESARARAELVEAQENLKDLTVIAPFDGTVVTRTAEPGEVIQAGTSIVTLLDLSKVYLRGFVPEGQIGRIKLGQAAHVFLDSDPKKPLDAVVSRIDPQATFTPENTYFRDDRVKQVVGLKLLLKSGIGYAKPGMPADGEVLVAER
jgi:HlyD family secretion protein